jgi:hypothetical protein
MKMFMDAERGAHQGRIMPLMDDAFVLMDEAKNECRRIKLLNPPPVVAGRQFLVSPPDVVMSSSSSSSTIATSSSTTASSLPVSSLENTSGFSEHEADNSYYDGDSVDNSYGEL